MNSIIISITILLVFFYTGYISSKLIFIEDPYLIPIFSLSFTIIYMAWFPAIIAFFIGFTYLAQILSMIMCIMLITAIHLITNKLYIPTFSYKKLIQNKTAAITIIPLLIISLYYMYTHILKTDASGNLMTGQSTYGDLSLHMSLISSISQQKTFPPFYNLLSRTIHVGYPFLCDSISSTFYSIGLSLRHAYIIPATIALLCLFISTYTLYKLWFKSEITAILSTILFYIGGGFGFVYFFDKLKVSDKFNDLFTGFYITPTNLVDNNIRWVNVIVDIIIPQRASLFGYAILLPCIILLIRLIFDKNPSLKYFLALSICASSLPMIHTHSFLALAILSSCYFLFTIIILYTKGTYILALKSWMIYAVLTAIAVIPQLFNFTFNQAFSHNFIRLHFNWSNSADNYLWFYIKNIGLPFLLITPAYINLKPRDRYIYLGGAFIFIVAELIVFQPNEYDNNKIMYIWYLLTCGIVANFLILLYKKIKPMRGLSFIVTITLIVLNISGVLTIMREAVSSYQLFSSDEVLASEFIIDNCTPDALFLTADNHNNTVASLAGRNIFCGSGSFLYFHGIPYEDLLNKQQDLFTNPSLSYLKENNIDYVYISPYENAMHPNYDFFDDNLQVFYKNKSITIYKV